MCESSVSSAGHLFTRFRVWCYREGWWHGCLENNYFTEMCSGSEEGSYLRLIDFVYLSTLGLRLIKKRSRRNLFLGCWVWCLVFRSEFGPCKTARTRL